MGHKLAIAAAILVLPAQASAQGSGPANLPECGRTMPFSRAMLEGASFTGGPLRAGGAYLVANLAGPGRGTLLFLRDRDGQWRGHAILARSSTLGVFRAQPSGNIFAWARNAEGPGRGFTGIHVSDTGGGLFCVDLPFPSRLDRPNSAAEAVSFDRFNVSLTGEGVVVGSAGLDRERGGQRRIFRYNSHDYGRTWSRPVKVKWAPPTPGAYRPVPGPAPADLVRSLMAQAR